MSDESVLVSRANIGADFKTFKTSNVGAFLIETALADEMAALRKLAVVNPEDKDRVYKTQLEAKVPRLLIQYIEDAIRRGSDAAWTLERSRQVPEY